MTKPIRKAYAAAFLQVAIIGFSFMFVIIALQSVSVLDLLTLRFFFAALVAGLMMFAGGSKLRLSRRAILGILPLSILYPIFFFGLQAYGLSYATTTEGGIISAMAPVFTVVLAGILLGERTSLRQGLLIGLSIAGLIYLTWVNSYSVPEFSLRGTALLVLSVAAMSLYIVLVRRVTQVYSFKDITSVILIFGGLFFLILSLINHKGLAGLVSSFAALGNPQLLVSVLYLGVLSSFISSLLNNYALVYLEAMKVSVLSNFSPVIATMAGVVVLGEPFSLRHLFGIALVLIGVVGVNYAR